MLKCGKMHEAEGWAFSECQITGIAVKVDVCDEIIAVAPSGIQMAVICCACVQGMRKQLQSKENITAIFQANVI